MPAPRRPKKALVQFAVALVVAVVLGIGALVVGFSIISTVSKGAEDAKQKAEKARLEAERELERLQSEKRKVVKVAYKSVQATSDLNPGQPITRDMVMLLDMDRRPDPGTATTLSQVVGKVVKSPILSGETVELSKILDTGSFISVESGMRAITIQVDPIGGLSGGIIPGMRVDVLTTLENANQKLTKTLLQNVQVIAVGDNAGHSRPSATRGPGAPGGSSVAASSTGNSSAVTLAVTPKQAEMLTLANDMGRFHLTLRSYGDKVTAAVQGADINHLLGLEGSTAQRPLPSQPNAPSLSDGFHNVNFNPDNLPVPEPAHLGAGGNRFTMQVYRGSGVETLEFQQ